MNAVSWVVLAAFGGTCALNWVSRVRPRGRLELVTKPLATVLAGVLCAVHGEYTAATTAALVAFALCLAGDVLLLDEVDVFVAGLGAFLLGHLVFVKAFTLAGFDHPRWSLVAVAIMAVTLATVGRRILHGARRSGPVLGAAVLAYLLVIAAMAVTAWATGRPAAMIGAAAFVASDSMLGWGRFVRPARWTSPAVMITYHLALGGLALAL